eukprot:s799_g9.t1
MHGNPVYTTNADDPLNNVYDTGMMDRVSMDVLFFGFHQAAVRFMAVDPNDPNLGVILGVLQAGMALFVEVLEALIEGMYWQETLVQPSGYLDPFLQNQVVNVTGCWRQTHGNWHRVAAQMMKKLMTFFGRIDELTEPSLSEEQKQAAWDGFQKVNLCRVFKLAKDVAASGQPMNWQVMPMLDAAGVNTMIMDLVQKNDPMVEPTHDLRMPWCGRALTEVPGLFAGLAGLQLEDLVIDGSYDEQSTWEDTAIRMDVGMRTCPVNLKDFKQDKGKWYDACQELSAEETLTHA